MTIYKDRSGTSVALWEFDTVRIMLEDADGTSGLLMLLRTRWPEAVTERRQRSLHIALDGNMAGQRYIYVDTSVTLMDSFAKITNL